MNKDTQERRIFEQMIICIKNMYCLILETFKKYFDKKFPICKNKIKMHVMKFKFKVQNKNHGFVKSNLIQDGFMDQYNLT